MEKIQTLISLSHDGISAAWFPFSFNFSSETIVSMGSNSEIHELMELVRLMFRTDNHRTETVDNLRFREKLFRTKISGSQTQCSIRFSTSKSEYILHKRFVNLYSVEVKLEKKGSSVIYYGKNALSIIDKFVKPVTIDKNQTMRITSSIFKSDNSFSRKNMIRLSNSWAEQLRLRPPVTHLNHNGEWNIRWGLEDPPGTGSADDILAFSQIKLLANLAQAVERKRTFGYCMPVIYFFRTGSIDFSELAETISLVLEVSQKENIQFLLFISINEEINQQVSEARGMNVIETPRLSIYALI
tara:strand:- start:116 stop:1012 length:897 start_codon:yes stop_codon:yes gene_type:complete